LIRAYAVVVEYSANATLSPTATSTPFTLSFVNDYTAPSVAAFFLAGTFFSTFLSVSEADLGGPRFIIFNRQQY
jgi:hypothetical protein